MFFLRGGSDTLHEIQRDLSSAYPNHFKRAEITAKARSGVDPYLYMQKFYKEQTSINLLMVGNDIIKANELMKLTVYTYYELVIGYLNNIKK